MKKVLTVGVFDLLHIGHVELFRRARKYGDYLIVAVQDSDVILQYKPEAKMVYSTEERCYMVRAIRYVDEVAVYRSFLFSAHSAHPFLEYCALILGSIKA